MPPRLRSRPPKAQIFQLKCQTPSSCIRHFHTPSRPNPTFRLLAVRASQRSFTTSGEAPAEPPSPRAEIEQALLGLKKDAANYVNLSRLQLALLGLRQPAGKESIRVAVLAVANGNGKGGGSAKEVLRLLLADPLKKEERWEVEIHDHDASHPLALKVGKDLEEGANGVIERKSMLTTVKVSSAVYDGYNLEVLFMETSPPLEKLSNGEAENAMLDLPVIIESGTGRFSPIRTPVHKALVVVDGIMGVSSISSLPPNEAESTIYATVNIPGYQAQDSALPFQPIDIAPAQEGLTLFRQSLDNAMQYERLWSQSNMSALTRWLRADIHPQPGTTKPAVRKLIVSVLQNTLAAARAAQAISEPTSQKALSTSSLQSALSEWAQRAHKELQDELDTAFTGRRWGKLGWWKLLWRADDVGMLTSEMISQRFLPQAENELVFLAGRIQQSRNGSEAPLPYSQPISSVSIPQATKATQGPGPASLPTAPPTATAPHPWPSHITFTRTYLLHETIPALQGLAQQLVLQAAGTFGLSTSLAALVYVSSSMASFYEPGAVFALGTVWGLYRLQRRWETARNFWEGEVREEGRKAVRAAEQSVGDFLEGTEVKGAKDGSEDLEKVRQLVKKAEDALERLK